MFYSIQEIETASPNAKITANRANSSQNKTLIHYKFIGTTCRRSRPIVRWSRGWTRQDLCIFTTLISQQNRNTRRSSIEIYFKQDHRLSTQLRRQFAVFENYSLRYRMSFIQIMLNLHTVYLCWRLELPFRSQSFLRFLSRFVRRLMWYRLQCNEWKYFCKHYVAFYSKSSDLYSFSPEWLTTDALISGLMFTKKISFARNTVLRNTRRIV